MSSILKALKKLEKDAPEDGTRDKGSNYVRNRRRRHHMIRKRWAAAHLYWRTLSIFALVVVLFVGGRFGPAFMRQVVQTDGTEPTPRIAAAAPEKSLRTSTPKERSGKGFSEHRKRTAAVSDEAGAIIASDSTSTDPARSTVPEAFPVLEPNRLNPLNQDASIEDVVPIHRPGDEAPPLLSTDTVTRRAATEKPKAPPVRDAEAKSDIDLHDIETHKMRSEPTEAVSTEKASGEPARLSAVHVPATIEPEVSVEGSAEVPISAWAFAGSAEVKTFAKTGPVEMADRQFDDAPLETTADIPDLSDIDAMAAMARAIALEEAAGGETESPTTDEPETVSPSSDDVRSDTTGNPTVDESPIVARSGGVVEHVGLPEKHASDLGISIQALVGSPIPEKRMAMIDNRITRQGDVVAGMRISFIGDTYIVCEKDGERWRVWFKHR